MKSCTLISSEPTPSYIMKTSKIKNFVGIQAEKRQGWETTGQADSGLLLRSVMARTHGVHKVLKARTGVISTGKC